LTTKDIASSASTGPSIAPSRSRPKQLRAIVDALQALRGVAKVTAVTLATEVRLFQPL